MSQKTPKIKHRAKVGITDSKGRVVQNQWFTAIQEFYDYGGSREVYLRLPVGTIIGKTEEFTVSVGYLGEKQYKQTYQQRVKALTSSEKRREKWEKEQARLKSEKQEKQLAQRRKRIMNQIELAFVKKGKDAVNFVTCDQCDAMATHLGLAYETPGSQVIAPEQITGAWCAEHDNQYQRPFKTKAAIACERLEFFYDGLRQLSVKAA
jgi:hypothetical protein